MTQNEIRLFKRFLKERGVYGIFLYNALSSNVEKCDFFKNRGCNLKKYLDTSWPICVLSNCFIWDDYNYWDDLNNEWYLYYKKYRK